MTDIPTHQRQLGLVMQDGALFPHLSVAENLRFAAGQGTSEHEIHSVLAQADLADMGDRDPATLSGGQRARVSLLRTLINRPKAVCLDEPFSKLDAELRDQIRQFTWQQTAGVPVVLVTHDAQDIPLGAQQIHLGACRARSLCDPSFKGPSAAVGRGAESAWHTRRQVTWIGFGIGMLAVVALAMNAYTLALLGLIGNRLADGVDGELARIQGPTDAGAFLDIALDFVFYAAFVLGFAIGRPDQA